MIKGIGCDIIEIDRVKRAIERLGSRFIHRIFTLHEIEYCEKHLHSYSHFAARFAAKEAIVKCLGTGFSQGISWHDITVINDDWGKPIPQLSDKLNTLFSHPKIHLSLSHTQSHALAFAVYESN